MTTVGYSLKLPVSSVVYRVRAESEGSGSSFPNRDGHLYRREYQRSYGRPVLTGRILGLLAPPRVPGRGRAPSVMQDVREYAQPMAFSTTRPKCTHYLVRTVPKTKVPCLTRAV